MKNKQFNSITELTRHTSDGPALANQLEARVNRRSLVKKLLALRAAKGLSQENVAESMGCSQSWVSKIESSDDDDIRLSDLRDYLRGIGLDVCLVISKHNWPATEQIKFHAFQIRERTRGPGLDV